MSYVSSWIFFFFLSFFLFHLLGLTLVVWSSTLTLLRKLNLSSLLSLLLSNMLIFRVYLASLCPLTFASINYFHITIWNVAYGMLDHKQDCKSIHPQSSLDMQPLSNPWSCAQAHVSFLASASVCA
ncbi:hypothetical protein L1049_020428 [Liquidambar formosana]|uniref:Uncharacterized protein n=1 Tax=Liquidambar formosana TaxID=63359 RepID=A0AAP0SD37_LIQFO